MNTLIQARNSPFGVDLSEFPKNPYKDVAADKFDRSNESFLASKSRKPD